MRIFNHLNNNNNNDFGAPSADHRGMQMTFEWYSHHLPGRVCVQNTRMNVCILHIDIHQDFATRVMFARSANTTKWGAFSNFLPLYGHRNLSHLPDTCSYKFLCKLFLIPEKL
jgi:hypothetical protein